MYKNLKILHIVGLVMFFGTILSHTIISIYSKTLDNLSFLNIVREIAQKETNFLLIPGLIILAVSGVGMILVGKLNIKESKWLKMHILIAIFVFLNSFFILIPLGKEILEISKYLIESNGQMDIFLSLKKRETIFGAINLILVILLIVIGVLKSKKSN